MLFNVKYDIDGLWRFLSVTIIWKPVENTTKNIFAITGFSKDLKPQVPRILHNYSKTMHLTIFKFRTTYTNWIWQKKDFIKYFTYVKML